MQIDLLIPQAKRDVLSEIYYHMLPRQLRGRNIPSNSLVQSIESLPSHPTADIVLHDYNRNNSPQDNTQEGDHKVLEALTKLGYQVLLFDVEEREGKFHQTDATLYYNPLYSSLSQWLFIVRTQGFNIKLYTAIDLFSAQEADPFTLHNPFGFPLA
jgi:hypothetical protein